MPPDRDPPCIARNDRLQLLRCLLADRDWSIEPLARARLERAVSLLQQPGAAIDETTWALLADETSSYLDYRRLGKLEAQLRGCLPEEFHYTRADWQASRVAEAALEAHHRRVRDSSYLPEPVPMFRIH